MQLAQANGMQQTSEQVLSLASAPSAVQEASTLRYPNLVLLQRLIAACLFTHFKTGISSGVKKTRHEDYGTFCFTFSGPCIVIYLFINYQQDAFFLS
jgi:hypothetical protein